MPALPIRAVVILILGLIVVLGVVLFATKMFKGGIEQFSLQGKFERGCKVLLTRGSCNFNSLDDPELGFPVDGETFSEVAKKLGYDVESLKRRCCSK
jgi:hypothetical protein